MNPSDPASAGDPGAAAPEFWRQDVELVSGTLRADETAIDGLMERARCVPRILTALNLRGGGALDDHELADLSQDVLILVWRKLASYDGRSALDSWMYGIARFEYLNAVRRGRRRPVPSDDVELSVARELDHDLPLDPERVRAALQELDPDEALAVRLRHYDDLTFESAAARLAIPLSTLKNRYYRGLERLAILLRSHVRETTN